MSDNSLAHSGEIALPLERPRAFDTILYGGLVVGVLDALNAVIFFGLIGTRPIGVFQYIASGLLGRASFNGGLHTALLGVLLHFLIAFVLAAVYYVVSLRAPVLIQRAVMCGTIYGVAAYFVMNFVVIPLSAAPQVSFSIAPLVNGVVGHALLVGLPIALFARRSTKANRRDHRT